MMPFSEVASAVAKKALGETRRVAEKITKDIAVEATRNGQKDAGWAGGSVAKDIISEIGTCIDDDKCDIAEYYDLEDIEERDDLSSEMEGDSREADLPVEIGGETKNVDSPRELESFSGPEVFPAEILPDKVDIKVEEKIDTPEKKGGSYKEVKENSEGDTYEVHHMPADSASLLERNDGPAIKMEKEDHRQTASCGNSKEARDYRVQQQELIEQGKFREALQMDIDDIHDKFRNKYDDAIAEMLGYVEKLEQEGNLNG